MKLHRPECGAFSAMVINKGIGEISDFWSELLFSLLTLGRTFVLAPDK
jgi:hypothetical protein